MGPHAPASQPLAPESSVDHGIDRVGRWQSLSVLTIFLFAMYLAIAARVSVWWQGANAQVLHDRLITLHATTMIFACLVPGIPFAIGKYLGRQILGAKYYAASSRIAWIRLIAYWLGTVTLVASLWFGRFTSGLAGLVNVYPERHLQLTWLYVGILLVGCASALNGFELITALGRFRAAHRNEKFPPTLIQLSCISAQVQILALPVAGATLLLLAAGQRLGFPFLDARQGGDAMLLRQLFWFYLQPLLTASLLPVFGVVCQIIEAESPEARLRHRVIVHAGVAIAMLGFVTWGNHLTTSGQSQLASTLSSAMGLLILVPSSLPFAIWLATLRLLNVKSWAAAAQTVSVTIMLALGILSSIPLVVLSSNIRLCATHFVTGHLHLLGASVVPVGLIAGIYCCCDRILPQSVLSRQIAWLTAFLCLGFLLLSISAVNGSSLHPMRDAGLTVVLVCHLVLLVLFGRAGLRASRRVIG